DAHGRLVVWKWESGAVAYRLPCHVREKKPVSCHCWHPWAAGKLLTASQDGDIKLWRH
ncbi:hypothetical protein KIPB_006497, partial [Kipferlia bialata]